MSADDIRKSLKVLEEGTSTEHSLLNEAAPMGFIKQLATTVGSLFSDLKLGELEVGSASNKLYNTYQKYLGRIGKKPGTEDVGDMYTFLVTAGVPENIIFKGLSRGFSTPQQPVKIVNKDDLIKWWQTDITTDYKNKIGKAFLNVSQEAFRLPEETFTPAAMQSRSKQGATTSQAMSSKATSTSNAPPVAAPNARFTGDVSIGLKNALSGKDSQAQIAAIDSAIKALSNLEESDLNELDLKKAVSGVKSWVKGLGKKVEPAPAAAPTVDFDTGDSDFDDFLKQSLQTSGKDAVIKALKAYKDKLTATSDPFEQYKSELRKLAGIKGEKVLPSKFKDALKTDFAKLSKGDKESGTFAADKIMKYAKAGYDVSNDINSWLQSAKVGERFLSIKEFQELSLFLSEHELDFADLGLVVRIDESISDKVWISVKE